MSLSGKTWAAGEALGAEHRTDHNVLSHTAGVSILAYGAGTAETGATNTAAIQNALDNESVVVVPAGPFELATAGANPYDGTHKYCIEVGSDTRLVLLPGAVLQLADGQQTDAGGPVDIVVGSAVSNVTITGTGSIIGNTSGQSGWTGGYQQSGGSIIRIYGGSTGITVDGITVGDHFSNAVYIGKTGSNSERVKVEGVYAYDCGEGILLENVDHSNVDNCVVEDASDVFVGDGVEWSECEFFASQGCHLIGPGAGSGFDVFNSKYGAISDFTVDGWNVGISIDDGPGGSEVVSVSDGVAVNCPSPSGAFNASGTGTRQITFQNCHARGATGPGFQLSNGLPGPTLLEACTAKGCQDGLIIGTTAGLSVVGGQFSENTRDGIRWAGLGGASTAADTANLFISAVSAYGNGRHGMLIEDNGGETSNLPTGGITNNMLLNNTTSNYTSQGVSDDNLTVTGNITS